MQPDPADIFKGKITMGGRPLEEADVSRRENGGIPSGGRDCKRIQNEFRLRKLRHRPEPVRTRTCLFVMGRMPLMIRIFPGREEGRDGSLGEKPKVSVLSNIPDIPVGESRGGR